MTPLFLSTHNPMLLLYYCYSTTAAPITISTLLPLLQPFSSWLFTSTTSATLLTLLLMHTPHLSSATEACNKRTRVVTATAGVPRNTTLFFLAGPRSLAQYLAPAHLLLTARQARRVLSSIRGVSVVQESALCD